MSTGRPVSRFQFFPAPWFARLVARPRFQKWAARIPFGKAIARRDGHEIFDVLQGFVKSQVLLALVELDILNRLLERSASAEQLGLATGVAPDRMERLLSAGVAIGLLKRGRDGRYALARKGAAILGVPGLAEMIRHNRAFYTDMADPVSLLKEEGDTKLSRFWPYVLGQAGDVPPDLAERYSALMSDSQALVAQDTLSMVSFKGVTKLLDVGGGSGAFLTEVLHKYPKINAVLFDLPEVAPLAARNIEKDELSARVAITPGSFRDEALPGGADAISLIRVLYDHDDQTVADLLVKAHAALPDNGRLIVSEPMSGGDTPEPAGDVYFSFYTMAMRTGRVRSAARIAEMCKAAGFGDARIPRAPRPYVTSVVTCKKLP